MGIIVPDSCRWGLSRSAWLITQAAPLPASLEPIVNFILHVRVHTSHVRKLLS